MLDVGMFDVGVIMKVGSDVVRSAPSIDLFAEQSDFSVVDSSQLDPGPEEQSEVSFLAVVDSSQLGRSPDPIALSPLRGAIPVVVAVWCGAIPVGVVGDVRVCLSSVS